ncbi:MAG: hypothetical protein HDS39_00845 [Bacteroides sp.]|nr:hypothetical protein [Bacteroides sp.]
MASTEIQTEYINIQTDFGFKHVFGNIDNKTALVRFLNALFEGRLTVTDVVYHDKEILPSEENGKRIVYDVYCEAARSSRLKDEEKVAYSQSLDKLRDTQAGIRFAADKAREEGRAEGEARGIQMSMIKIAKKMKAMGSSVEEIAALTDLPVAEIEKL